MAKRVWALLPVMMGLAHVRCSSSDDGGHTGSSSSGDHGPGTDASYRDGEAHHRLPPAMAVAVAVRATWCRRGIPASCTLSCGVYCCRVGNACTV